MGVLRRLQPRPTESVAGADAPPADPLRVLIQLVGRGDQSAFGELYDAVMPLVHGVVLKVVRDPSQTEEVVQEVFVELWRIAPRFDAGRGSVTSWVATIAHRRAVDRVRSEQSTRNRIERELQKIEPARRCGGGGASSTSITPTSSGAVCGAPSTGSPSMQRQAVELAYFGGYTYREVAVLLDVPEGTIKTRIRDGMIRLRDELGASA